MDDLISERDASLLQIFVAYFDFTSHFPLMSDKWHIYEYIDDSIVHQWSKSNKKNTLRQQTEEHFFVEIISDT